MALPIFYPFKTRTLQASSTTTNSIMSVAVPARGRLIGAYYATSPQSSHTAVGTATVAVNGTSVTGMTAITVTTSTGDGSTNLGAPTVTTNVKAGDVLSVSCSSCVGGTATFIVKEF